MRFRILAARKLLVRLLRVDGCLLVWRDCSVRAVGWLAGRERSPEPEQLYYTGA